MRIRKTLFAIVMGGAVLAMPLIGQSADFGAGKVRGKSYAERSAEWWQWAFDSDFAQFQPGDVDCSAGQRSRVWFLGGSFGEGPEDRSCIKRIPRWTTLFFPLVTSGFWNPDDSCPEPDHNCTVAEKRAMLDDFFSDQVPGVEDSYACQLRTTVGGVPVQDLGYPIVRTQSPTFPLMGTLEEMDVDDPQTVSDGYWVALPPLAPGDHIIHIKGGLCSFDDSPADIAGGATPVFLADLTYHITVGRGVH